jgi:predicted phosphodiesterase
MKFLHTADWHIGLKASHLGAAGARVRGERFSAARRAIRAANERGVDFVAVAGDMFDDNSVKPEAVKEAVSILETSSAPVYIIPGNHDYICPGSVWEHEAWGRSGKIRVLADKKPVDIGEAVLFPCPVCERASAADPTAWIPAGGGPPDKIRIAIAHGSVQGLPKEELDFPIPRGLPARKNLDYAMLGHWHSYSVMALDGGGACRMAYCGSHETAKFGKPDSGCVAVVTIEKRGSAPAVERIDTGGLAWIDRKEEIDGGDAISAVIESVMGIAGKESALVSLELSGVYGLSDVGALNELRAIGESGRFLYFRVDDGGLRLARGDIRSDTGWIGDIGEPLVREAASRIAGMAGGADKSVPDRALLELYMISGGAGK